MKAVMEGCLKCPSCVGLQSETRCMSCAGSHFAVYIPLVSSES